MKIYLTKPWTINMQFKQLIFHFGITFLFILSAVFPQQSILAQPDQIIGCHQVKRELASVPVTRAQRERARASLERSDTIDVLHYTIELDVTQFGQNQIRATTEVVFTPRMQGVQVLNLDLEGLTVDSVYNVQDSLEYHYDGLLLSIQLPEPLSEEDTMSVFVDYHGTPVTCPSGFGGFYFEEGYAYNLGIGLQAEPHNFGRSWYPCFDNFVERSTYEYRVLSDQKNRAFCVGRLDSHRVVGTDSVLRVFVMDKPIPSYLSHVAVSEYTAVRQMHPSQFRDLPIRLVSKPSDTSNFKSSFSALGDAIDCFEEWYGPYAFDQVGYTITPRGAMEHPTAVAYPASGIANGSPSIELMAHELCHHWWGNVVTLETSADMWIKEGPATYGEHLIKEYLNGQEALADAVRTNNHYVIHNAHVQDSGYLALSPMPEHITYGTHTYRRGALVLHNLRTYLGDERYRMGMQSVLQQRKWGNIDAEEFRMLLENETGISLEHFFEDWVYAPGWSDFEIDSLRVLDETVDQTTVRLYIEQKLHHAPHFHEQLPLRIAFFNEDLTMVERTIYVRGRFSEAEVDLPFKPVSWYVNPGQALNISSFNTHQIVREEKEYEFAHDLLTTTVRSIRDSALVSIEHHYTEADAPDELTADARFSKSHYWTVRIEPEDQVNIQASYRYSATGSNNFEQDLTSETEDSLHLMYRPSAAEDWTVYPYYRKIQFIPGDGSGFITIDTLKSGQYAFANTAPVAIDQPKAESPQLKVYPNPVTDALLIDIPSEIEGNSANLTVYDRSGKNIYREEVNLHYDQQLSLNTESWNIGQYFILLLTERGERASGAVIKQ